MVFPMFTGIIEATAAILDPSPTTFTIERPGSFTDITIGSSICVSGVCLTIVEFDDASMTFTVVEETLKKSTLGSFKKGDRVNLERAMKAGDRLDGHVVQGHVEGTGKVVAPPPQLTVSIPKDLQKFVIPKGSIALDGVSLTIAEIDEDRVTVALIPHTLEHTTLGALKKGDRVNVETDMLLRSPAHAH